MKTRVGFVGTGQISEFHLAALRRIQDVELVGVFDVDQEKAAKWAAAAGSTAYPSINALRDAGADVIHVLTPPHTHASVAIEALRLGCHVYVEKPLALNAAECDAIAAAAEQAGKKVCVSHSLLYDPQIRRALDLVKRGKLGKVVAVDILRSSVYPPFAGGALPPQYRSASYPFRDLGIHALYLFEAFLGPIENVSAHWASLGGDPNLAFDEWRTLVRCRDGLGQFQLSWNAKPLQSQIVIQGTKGVLRVDLFLMSQGLRSVLPLPKAVERVANALSDAIPMFFDVPKNAFRFVTKRALPYHGLQDLIRAFYEALASNHPIPVVPQDARSTVYWTEKISQEAELDHEENLRSLPALSNQNGRDSGPVLITGASGALGGAVARALEVAGVKVRLFVRRAPSQIPQNVEVALGNLGDPTAVNRAVRGASMVIHAGAAMAGPWEEHEGATIAGTKNILEACREFGVQKLVYVSSMSVSDWAGAAEDSVLDENSALEPRAEGRGFYTRAKLAAERMVVEFVAQNHLSTVILRPGKIFGPRQPVLSPAIGWKIKGRWLVLGDAGVRIPFVYIDDVVDAVIAAARSEAHSGEIIQITDPVQLTQLEVLKLCEGEKVRTMRMPRWMVFALAYTSQVLLGLLKRPSPLSVYRMKSALAKRRFVNSNAHLLDWRPRVGVMEGIKRELERAPTGLVKTASNRQKVADLQESAQTTLKQS
jgi:predicted dehydrogenase/nucleoside-diphosphate-sugar epimerase